MRLGIFGGSFDPIHHGHLQLARCCLEQANLDEVWLMPAARQPLKPTGPRGSDEDRWAMIQLAIVDHDSLRLCRLELERGGTSYTVDTLDQLHAERPSDQLFFLVGADSLAELPSWHDPHGILQRATLLVVARAGEPEPDCQAIESLLSPCATSREPIVPIQMPPVPISSSQIRRRQARGESIDDLVPPAVAEYIGQHGLYAET